MEVTKSRLKQIIKEELENMLEEAMVPLPMVHRDPAAGSKPPKPLSKEVGHATSIWHDALEHCTGAHPDDEMAQAICRDKYVRKAGLYADKPVPDYDVLKERTHASEEDLRAEWLVDRVGELFRRITELEKQIGVEWKGEGN